MLSTFLPCWWIQKQILKKLTSLTYTNVKQQYSRAMELSIVALLTLCSFLAMVPSFSEALVTNTIHQKAPPCESGHDLLQTPLHSLHNYTGSCNVGSLITCYILMLVLTLSFFSLHNILSVCCRLLWTYVIRGFSPTLHKLFLNSLLHALHLFNSQRFSFLAY